MPAFTFEKISPPSGRTPTSSTSPSQDPPKQRNFIVQILDRLVESRFKSLRDERYMVARSETKSAD
jgi:hypothetical protein